MRSSVLAQRMLISPLPPSMSTLCEADAADEQADDKQEMTRARHVVMVIIPAKGDQHLRLSQVRVCCGLERAYLPLRELSPPPALVVLLSTEYHVAPLPLRGIGVASCSTLESGLGGARGDDTAWHLLARKLLQFNLEHRGSIPDLVWEIKEGVLMGFK